MSDKKQVQNKVLRTFKSESSEVQNEKLRSFKSESSVLKLDPKSYSVCNNCKLAYTTDTCYRCRKRRKSLLSL